MKATKRPEATADLLVTATEGARLLADLKVTRHNIAMWRLHGRIATRGKRGRSPLYRFGDILRVERDTRCSGLSRRGPRSVERSVVPAR